MMLSVASLDLTEFLYLSQLDSSSLNGDSELADLSVLLDRGLKVAPILIVPSAIEEAYYQLNNLPEQLQQLFKHVDLTDPDEDDIEDLEPQAQDLFKKHFLLDETIDLFYAALKPLPAKLSLRRPNETGRDVLKGRPALIALKELWAKPWTFDALLSRLEQSQSIAIEARSVLIHDIASGEAVQDEVVVQVLQKELNVLKNAAGQIVQLQYE